MIAETEGEVKNGSQTDEVKADFKHAIRLIWAGPLFALFVVIGLEIFGAAMTFPVFAFFVIHELKLSATSMGVLGSCFNLSQAIGSPIFGRVSDAVGRKWVMLSCFAWSASCFAGTYFVQGFWDLLFVRTLAGLSGGSIPIGAAMVMDAASVAERPQVLGIKGAVFGICFTSGPLLAVLLLHLGLLTERRNVFVIAAFFCFSGFVVACLILKETLPPEKRRPLFSPTTEEGREILKEQSDEWSSVTAGMLCVWVTRFFYAFATYVLFTTYAFLVKDNFGWSDKELGMLMGMAGVSEGLLGVFLYPIVDKKFGEHFVCVVGFAFMACAHLFLPSPVISIHLLAFLGFQIGQCFAEPGVINLVGFHCPSERDMGFAQGMGNCFKSCASVVAPITAGMLYDIKPFYAYACASAMAGAASIFVLMARALHAPRGPENTALIKKDLDEERKFVDEEW